MRKPYPSDLTDEQWEIFKPLFPQHRSAGPARSTPMREVLNAIFYLHRSGCPWDTAPPRPPPRSTVHDSSYQWRRNGTVAGDHGTLRRRVRVAAGKEPEPSAGSLDSQTVKATRDRRRPGLRRGPEDHRSEAAYRRGHLRVAPGRGGHGGLRRRPGRGPRGAGQAPGWSTAARLELRLGRLEGTHNHRLDGVAGGECGRLSEIEIVSRPLAEGAREVACRALGGRADLRLAGSNYRRLNSRDDERSGTVRARR